MIETTLTEEIQTMPLENEQGHFTTFIGSCGKNLYCKYWKPSSIPRGMVMLVHGLGEHLEMYEELGSRLVEENLLVFGHDLIGHGRSEGHRVHVDCFDDYVSDVLLHIRKMKEKFPSLPIFAVGHSMGGMITLRAAMKDPGTFSGVVLMGPLIYIDPNVVSPFRIWIAKLLSRIVPQVSVGGVDIVYLTRDEATQKKMKSDPLRWGGGIKFKWAIAIYEALVEINSNLDTMQVPFLVIHGEKDILCKVEGSKLLYEKAATSDKQLKIFKNAHHQLYLEPLEVREEALCDTVQWICQRISPH